MKSRPEHAPPLLLHLGVEGAPRTPSRARLQAPLAEARWICAVISYIPSSTIETKEVVGSRKARQAEPGDRQLRRLQLLEAAAQVDEHEVALVAEQRDGHGRALLAPLHGGEGVRRLGGQPLAQLLRPRALPLRPADAEHLVEDAPAFERLGDARIVHAQATSADEASIRTGRTRRANDGATSDSGTLHRLYARALWHSGPFRRRIK